jgi:hypothetical protein
MNVEGLTRENVASHLQKFRLMRKAPEDTTITAALKSDKGTSSNSTWPLEGTEQSHSERKEPIEINNTGN